jgi:indole-3-glycerol phosphate synthase
MSDILERILATKRVEVECARAAHPLAALRTDAERRGDLRDFVGAMRRRLAAGQPAVIAEVKKASPSKGVLRAIAAGSNSARPSTSRRHATRAGCLRCARTSSSMRTRWSRRARWARTRSC